MLKSEKSNTSNIISLCSVNRRRIIVSFCRSVNPSVRIFTIASSPTILVRICWHFNTMFYYYGVSKWLARIVASYQARHWHRQVPSDLSLEKHVSVVDSLVRPAFSISGIFVVSGSHWMRSQQQHSSMRLWLLALTTATPYWPGRRSSQQTSCSAWWILLPASLATLGSSTAACRGYCTTNSTGSMSPTEYNSSSPCWWTDVFMELLRCTWWKVAHK